MGSDDLRLNSLDRFTKSSPRFVLEEHSHCEVPAGCGGVVLRWIDPKAGLPIVLNFFHTSEATVAIDDIAVTTTHLLLAPGRHVLTIEFAEAPADGTALFILVGRLKVAAIPPGEQVIVRSTADESWVFTTAEPPAGWTSDPDLEAPDCKRLVKRPVAEPPPYGDGWFAFQRASRHGDPEALGVPPGTARLPIRVRTIFTVPTWSRQ